MADPATSQGCCFSTPYSSSQWTMEPRAPPLRLFPCLPPALPARRGMNPCPSLRPANPLTRQPRAAGANSRQFPQRIPLLLALDYPMCGMTGRGAETLGLVPPQRSLPPYCPANPLTRQPRAAGANSLQFPQHIHSLLALDYPMCGMTGRGAETLGLVAPQRSLCRSAPYLQQPDARRRRRNGYQPHASARRSRNQQFTRSPVGRTENNCPIMRPAPFPPAGGPKIARGEAQRNPGNANQSKPPAP